MPEIWVLDFGSAVEKWIFGQIEQQFSSFFAKFLALSDDFSKWSIPKTLQNFEKLSNCQKMKKIFVQHDF